MRRAAVHVAWLLCRWRLGRSTDGAWLIHANRRVVWPLRLLLEEGAEPSRLVMFAYRGCEFRWMLEGRRHHLWWRAEG